MELYNFKKYFWDCKFEDLSIERYPEFITERILMFGTEEECNWIREKIGDFLFKKIATTSRNLDKKTINYWRKYFGIQKSIY